MTAPKIFAIDYGTSNTLLGAADTKTTYTKVPIDPASESSHILKSIIFSRGADDWHFGTGAVNKYLEQPTMGRLFKSLKKFLPDPAFKGTQISGQFFTIQDLIAKLLRFLRDQANEHLSSNVDQVVMGHPALFSSNPEQHELALNRLRAAAIAAGFKEISFCPEPVAAAYHFRHKLDREKLVLVADFGGGTSDFTVVKMSASRFQADDVLAIGGISRAGDHYDSAIMYHLISPFFGSKITYRKPMTSNEMSFPKGLIRKISSPADIVFLNRSGVMNELKAARRYITKPEESFKLDQLIFLIEEFLGYAIFKKIEETKVELTTTDNSKFYFNNEPINIELEVSVEDFEAATHENSEKILACLDDVIAKAQIKPQDIDIVCLTGGTASVPAIRRGLEQRFAEKVSESARFQSVVQGLTERAQEII